MSVSIVVNFKYMDLLHQCSLKVLTKNYLEFKTRNVVQTKNINRKMVMMDGRKIFNIIVRLTCKYIQISFECFVDLEVP